MTDSSTTPRPADLNQPNRFGYFVIQARSETGADGNVVRVLLEDLSTGEKRSFATTLELGRFLETWGSREEAEGREMRRGER